MKLLITGTDGAIAQEYGGVHAQIDGIPISGAVITVVIPGESGEKTYHVEVNMTGERASRDFPSESLASSACRALNLDAGPGGKYGVYDSEGNRV